MISDYIATNIQLIWFFFMNNLLTFPTNNWAVPIPNINYRDLQLRSLQGYSDLGQYRTPNLTIYIVSSVGTTALSGKKSVGGR